jgi:site-specific DNA-methyltransferase (adenine-specific)
MLEHNQVHQMDCLVALTSLPDASIDVTLTDPPYPNRMGLFDDTLIDGYAALYTACRKTRHFVVFFWNPTDVPQAPPGWFEVARHVWHKPDCKSITHYEVIVVWARDDRRKVSRVWSIPILDYRSLRDWKPHPTQKPVKLLRYLLDLYTQAGDLVCDPFVGTGTTAIACQQLSRHFIAFEHNPDYFKIATDRLAAPTSRPFGRAEAPEDPAEEMPVDPDALPADPVDTQAAEPPAAAGSAPAPATVHAAMGPAARPAAHRPRRYTPRHPSTPTTAAPPTSSGQPPEGGQ